MGINDFSLSPEMIASLYPDTLVLEKTGAAGRVEPAAVGDSAKPPATLPFMGGNARSLCFLVHHPGEDFIPAGRLVFLKKILAACKCSLDDIALVNTAGTEFTISELKTRLHPELVFLWGPVPFLAERTKVLPDMVLTALDGIPLLPVFRVRDMDREGGEATELKRQLWDALKKIFSL